MPFFRETLKEFIPFPNYDKALIKSYSSGRCGTQKLFQPDVITKILREHSGQQMSLKRIKDIYEKKTNFNKFSLSTFRKYVRQRLNFRFKKVVSINVKRKQHRFKVMNSVFAKKFIQHTCQNKTFIFIDESSFQGFNNKLHSWQEKNNPRVMYNYGRNHSFCLIAATTEFDVFHYEISDNTMKAKDFLSFLKQLLQKIKEKNKLLHAFQKPSYVLYMDNAPTHTHKEVLEFLKDQQIDVLFGVPFSPDLNPIELFFSEVKKNFYQKIWKTK